MRDTIFTPRDLADRAAQYVIENGYSSPGAVREEMMERSLSDDLVEALDGCFVEDDGICPHGWPSWLRYAGLI